MNESESVEKDSDDAFDVVVMAGSAGGLHALSTILGALPADFSAAIAIVQHRHPQQATLLAEILRSRCALLVKDAAEGDRLEPGVVHLAPPARHLLVTEEGRLSLCDGPLQSACCG